MDTLGNTAGNAVGLYPCHGGGGNQVREFRGEGRWRGENRAKRFQANLLGMPGSLNHT